MRISSKKAILWATGAVSLANLALGWMLVSTLLATGGAIGLCYVLLRCSGSALLSRSGAERLGDVAASRPAKPVAPVTTRPAADPTDTGALVEQMLAQGRLALLLRRQIAEDIDDGHLNRVLAALDDTMAMVPDGEVVLGRIDEALEDGSREDWEHAAREGRVVRVERFFLDRHPVTNRQFHEFVAAGCYEQMSLWDERIQRAVLDFVDQSGRPGPRFWRNGRYAHGREEYPVVGVSWHEAAAYARWVGKRLPTNAEWVKAASWPVPVSSTATKHRRYPWGNTMDRGRANLWGSGQDGTVDVRQFTKGTSVGGVHQLIGNVWEWTASNFQLPSSADELLAESSSDDRRNAESDDRELQASTLKSIHGGAFDTYFDNQATCQFQSGERMTARKHNIGFRLAVGTCDLMLGRPPNPPAEAATDEPMLSVVSH